MGEATKEYENGQVVSTEGSWEAGVDGAKAGIVMFAHPEVGEAYWQEFYVGHAEDLGRFLSLDTCVPTKAGVLRRVRMTEDTTALHPEIAELKFYAPSVGIVLAYVEIAISVLPASSATPNTTPNTQTTRLHPCCSFSDSSATSESSPMRPASRTPAAAPNIATEITSSSATCSTYGGALLNT